MKSSMVKAGKNLFKVVPLVLGTLLLISLISVLIPKSFYDTVFNGNLLEDSFLGSLIGSISAGNPITSYIMGGEFLAQGVSLLAVTSFLVAWVTVGVIQLPMEISVLGKKFALLRNITAFVLSIITAMVTVIILRI